MFGGFYTPSQYQYDNWVNIQLTVSKGHFLNLDPGSGQVCLCNTFGQISVVTGAAAAHCWHTVHGPLALQPDWARFI